MVYSLKTCCNNFMHCLLLDCNLLAYTMWSVSNDIWLQYKKLWCMLIVWQQNHWVLFFITSSIIFYNTQQASLICPSTGIESYILDEIIQWYWWSWLLSQISASFISTPKTVIWISSSTYTNVYIGALQLKLPYKLIQANL